MQNGGRGRKKKIQEPRELGTSGRVCPELARNPTHSTHPTAA